MEGGGLQHYRIILICWANMSLTVLARTASQHPTRLEMSSWEITTLTDIFSRDPPLATSQSAGSNVSQTPRSAPDNMYRGITGQLWITLRILGGFRFVICKCHHFGDLRTQERSRRISLCHLLEFGWRDTTFRRLFRNLIFSQRTVIKHLRLQTMIFMFMIWCSCFMLKCFQLCYHNLKLLIHKIFIILSSFDLWFQHQINAFQIKRVDNRVDI